MLQKTFSKVWFSEIIWNKKLKEGTSGLDDDVGVQLADASEAPPDAVDVAAVHDRRQGRWRRREKVSAEQKISGSDRSHRLQLRRISATGL